MRLLGLYFFFSGMSYPLIIPLPPNSSNSCKFCISQSAFLFRSLSEFGLGAKGFSESERCDNLEFEELVLWQPEAIKTTGSKNRFIFFMFFCYIEQLIRLHIRGDCTASSPVMMKGCGIREITQPLHPVNLPLPLRFNRRRGLGNH